jgi:hypothetical protein
MMVCSGAEAWGLKRWGACWGSRSRVVALPLVACVLCVCMCVSVRGVLWEDCPCRLVAPIAACMVCLVLAFCHGYRGCV